MKHHLPVGKSPSCWPVCKQAVLDVANRWYRPDRVAVDENAIARLSLPPIRPGAESAMTVGKMEWSQEESIALSIALNSINYQFWDIGKDGSFIRYEFGGVVGAQGMRKAFEDAWNSPESHLSACRAGTHRLTVEDIHAVFGEIPSAQSRADILNEVLGSSALSRLSSEISSSLNRGCPADVSLASHVADMFPLAYGDEVLKKAQLAISEVWVNREAAGFPTACELTAFADYQIPNILRALGVLSYAPDLADRIDAQLPIDENGEDERAIRAASILAVEQIALKEGVPVAAVDHYLWMRRKEAKTPFHLTFTTAY